MRPHSPRSSVAFAATLFFLSGAAALVYQVIWQRMLGIFSGLHIYSVTLIVSAFMAGLGIGSLAGGRLADTLPRARALVAFAACEAAIGVFALASPFLYYDLAYVRLGYLVEYPLLLPIVHFSLLLVPTMLMGASLPLLARGLVPETAGAARVVGTLYGLNAIGAGVGAAGAVWVGIGQVGFRGTIALAALLNLLVAAGAWLVSRRVEREADARLAERPAPAPFAARAPEAPTAGFGLMGWAGIYALSGFVALSLEILWFRLLDVAIKSSPFTFGHLLALFLFFLGLGSVFGARSAPASRRPEAVFFWGQYAIGVSAALVLVALSWLPPDRWPLAGLYAYWSTDRGIDLAALRAAWSAGQAGDTWRAIQVYGLLPIALLAVPTFLMGWTYPYVQRVVQTDLREVGWRVGVVQGANIAGSMAGSLVTGLILLTFVGTPGALKLIVLAGAVFGLLALSRSDARRPTLGLLGVLGTSLALAWGLPDAQRFWARLHGSPAEQVQVAEDASAIVALQDLPHGRAVMRVNGTGHSVLPYGGPHAILGLAPTLVHPNPRRVLLIGLGAGASSWSALAVPEIERLDVYEIAQPEYALLDRLVEGDPGFAAVRQLLDEPRLHVTFSDGRLALRHRGQRYDVIEADALEPYMAYSGNLYSKEFFELAASALAPGGIVCTYTPTVRTLRTAASAFPYVLYFDAPGVLRFIIGSNEPVEWNREAAIERLRSEPVQSFLREGGVQSRILRDVEHFLQVVHVTALEGGERERFAAGDWNTDLFPRDEYTAAANEE